MSIENGLPPIQPSGETYNDLKKKEQDYSSSKKSQDNSEQSPQDIASRIEKMKKEENGWVG